MGLGIFTKFHEKVLNSFKMFSGHQMLSSELQPLSVTLTIVRHCLSMTSISAPESAFKLVRIFS